MHLYLNRMLPSHQIQLKFNRAIERKMKSLLPAHVRATECVTEPEERHAATAAQLTTTRSTRRIVMQRAQTGVLAKSSKKAQRTDQMRTRLPHFSLQPDLQIRSQIQSLLAAWLVKTVAQELRRFGDEMDKEKWPAMFVLYWISSCPFFGIKAHYG